MAIPLLCLFLSLSAVAFLFLTKLRYERALASNEAVAGSRMRGFPRLFLWAWERPEELEFIDTREVGVAFLARTLYLRNTRVIERPRMQPLRVPKDATLMAVVRIETVREDRPALSATQRAEVVSSLLEVSRLPRVRAIQIDFDALESERQFYKSLLEDLRGRLPTDMPLSITALASWCIYDNWLDGLPVDEAVPMLFSMGMDERRIKSYLGAGEKFRSPLCRMSAGISTDEPSILSSNPVRTYVFSTRAWTEESVRKTIERSLNETSAP